MSDLVFNIAHLAINSALPPAATGVVILAVLFFLTAEVLL